MRAQTITPGFGTPETITSVGAAAFVEGLYPDDAVEIFRMPFDSKNSCFFVDLEPDKGWEHDCVKVSVRRGSDAKNPTYYEEHMRMPPNVSLTPIRRKQAPDSSFHNLIIPPSNELDNNNEYKEHTYAIILSGGWNVNNNHERYWNDCSFIYQTLVNKYSIPKDNISVLMSDGQDPGLDMTKVSTWGRVSSPLDLDYDGEEDIQYPADREHLIQVLKEYQRNLLCSR